MSISFRSLVLVGVLALSACDTAEERAEKHFQSGMELLNSGDPQRAIVEFRNVFTLNKNHIRARMAYARATRSTGNISESYANFLAVAEARPQNMEARLALTELAIVSQNLDEAERHGAALIQAETSVDGSDIPLLALKFREAVLAEDAAARREVTREAEALLDDNPESEILFRILIEGYGVENDVDKALAITDIAISQSSDDPLFYQVKASLLAQKQDPKLLEDHLRQTIAKFPNDNDSKSVLVRILVSQGDLLGAQEFLRSEIAASDDPMAAHVTLIAFIQQTESGEKALTEIESALPLYEDNRVLQALKAGLLFDSGETTDAINILQKVVDESEPSADTDRFSVTLARMLVASGNETGARQLVGAVLELSLIHI